jgi:hypothetical protein
MLFDIWKLLTKRPFVGDQTTARLALAQSQGYTFAGINGGAGFTVKGQVAATYPMGITPNPTAQLNDPTVTGNPNHNLDLDPLTRPVAIPVRQM